MTNFYLVSTYLSVHKVINQAVHFVSHIPALYDEVSDPNKSHNRSAKCGATCLHRDVEKRSTPRCRETVYTEMSRNGLHRDVEKRSTSIRSN
ncbi:hypothetical protein RRG08_023694 [Elysia crispata]|uniref:Uncharacterized protein n=1 Tax=Elysia crispata TaxID=231223 RepID=A0AAE1D954_9GAST|nr:hypothetical protein RRG08_023694 [Elysia crispata]